MLHQPQPEVTAIAPASAPAVVEPRPNPVASQRSLGLRLGVARTVEEVVESWRLVYVSYRYSGLIAPNRHRIYTSPAAVSAQTAVITGSIDALIVTTLTALIDGPGGTLHRPDGLPLDNIYHQELDVLRQDGRRLMELGLFADRRLQLARTAETLFQLTRYAFAYGQYQNVTDVVIGVPQRNASFYGRWFGFAPCGAAHGYTAVRGQPIVLLRRDMTADASQSRAMIDRTQMADEPVPESLFADRFNFDPRHVAGSPIERYVAETINNTDLGKTA